MHPECNCRIDEKQKICIKEIEERLLPYINEELALAHALKAGTQSSTYKFLTSGFSEYERVVLSDYEMLLNTNCFDLAQTSQQYAKRYVEHIEVRRRILKNSKKELSIPYNH